MKSVMWIITYQEDPTSPFFVAIVAGCIGNLCPWSLPRRGVGEQMCSFLSAYLMVHAIGAALLLVYMYSYSRLRLSFGQVATPTWKMSMPLLLSWVVTAWMYFGGLGTYWKWSHLWHFLHMTFLTGQFLISWAAHSQKAPHLGWRLAYRDVLFVPVTDPKIPLVAKARAAALSLPLTAVW